MPSQGQKDLCGMTTFLELREETKMPTYQEMCSSSVESLQSFIHSANVYGDPTAYHVVF